MQKARRISSLDGEPNMTNIVIASAARTAVGSFNGSFANTPAHDLGAAEKGAPRVGEVIRDQHLQGAMQG